MSLKEKMQILLENGYVDISDTALWPNLIRAVNGLNEGAIVRAGSIVMGNERFCADVRKTMLDQLALKETVTTENSFSNILDSDSFIDIQKSSNYICEKVLKPTGKNTAIILTCPIELKTGRYAVLKSVDSGDVRYEVSLDSGKTFERIIQNQGTFLRFDGTQVVMKITLSAGSKVSKFGLAFR